jgi:hypothetical protein
MPVQGLLALALALPTGALFGIGYGTGVRIGYEQIYPLLFPGDKARNTEEVVTAVKEINKIYDSVGGKEASQMGIADGIASHLSDLKKNLTSEDWNLLIYGPSGDTSLNLRQSKASATTGHSTHSRSYEGPIQETEPPATALDGSDLELVSSGKVSTPEKEEHLARARLLSNPPTAATITSLGKMYERADVITQSQLATWDIERAKKYATARAAKETLDRTPRNTKSYSVAASNANRHKEKYVAYLLKSRQSRNHLIKVAGTNYYNARHWKKHF